MPSIALALFTLTLAVPALAGPLDPPPGPVTSTGKTLTEIEPRVAINASNTPGDATSLFRISQPGSYYLTSNVSLPAGVPAAITIDAMGVTLDLNGFTIDGNAHFAIGISVRAAGVSIRNGTVTRTGFSGISMDQFPTGAPGMVIEDIRVINQLGSGIPPGGSPGAGTAGIFAGRGAIIRNCYVNNAALGIAAGFNSSISGCTVEFARQHGFHLQGGASISDCVVVGTGGGPTEGGHAFFLGTGSSATNCVARSNTGSGFVTQDECSITDSSATSNITQGFSVGDRCHLRGCIAATNGANGFLAGNGGSISTCTSSDNTLAGIEAGEGCAVTGCGVYRNRSIGIATSGGATISGCTVRRNSFDGIWVTAQSLVIANTCASNGNDGNGAGIHATGTDNRIEGNNCTLADRGIDADSSHNIIIKNSCSGNSSNWDIAAGNVCLVVQGVFGGAVVGDSGGAAPGSADPNANFTY
ncbi:MAG: right-handed parallel beta-helix repeat-containing protein [Phycisphaerales bacterium]|nr:right-handed parallel beta-helix repeat-containing protein [Phycisphaerales bacterium]